MSNEDETQEQPQQPSNEDVERYLREKENKDTGKEEKVPLDVDPDTVKAVAGTGTEEKDLYEEEGEAPENVNERQHPATEPDLRTNTVNIYDQLLEPDVKPEPSDYRMFMKGLVMDEPVEMDIKQAGDVVVTVRDRNVYENNVLMQTLLLDQQADSKGFVRVRDTLSYATYMQQYLAAMTLVAFNNERVSYVAFKNPILDYTAAAKQLREHTAKTIEVMSQPKWLMVERSLRIFETKMSILRYELRTQPGNFSDPAK